MENQEITATKQPKSFLWLAILSTVLTLLFPVGLVSLYYSIKVKKSLKAGNTEEAEKASSRAKIWGIVASILGVIMIIASTIILTVLIAIIAALISLLSALAAALPMIAPIIGVIISILGSLSSIMTILAEIAVAWALIEDTFSTILLMPLF